MISDITGDSQKLADQTIGVSYGDLMLAGIACGLVEAESGWSSGVGTSEPTRRTVRSATSSFRLHGPLPATRPMDHTLAGMQAGGEF